MTDVTGSMFISYRRSPGRPSGDAEALLVRDALRDRGVPTWRDLDDLNPVPTEEDLSRILRSEEIAGAIMLVSPETEKSDMVRVVEAPAILERFQRRDGFFLQPVLINLDYDEADRVLGRPGGFQEIKRFDIARIAKESLEIEDAQRIARAVLRQRVEAIRLRQPEGPFHLGLYNRLSPSMKGHTLCHDVTPYFQGREAGTGAYTRIEAALLDAATALAATGEKPRITAHGNAALPLGVLFGAVYTPFIFDLVWEQISPGTTTENWSIKCGPATVATTIRRTLGEPNSEDVVLAISINANVDHAVAEYLSGAGFSPRATISVELADGPLQRGRMISPHQGLRIAYDAIDYARNLKDQLRMRRMNLHLFLACPLSLAVLIGQNLNTFGECVVYEHFSDRIPSYAPAHRFKPSSFTYQK